MNCDGEKNRSPIELKIVADDATELRAQLASLLEERKYNNATLEQHVKIYKRENQTLRAIIEFLDHTNRARTMLGVDASELLESIRRGRNSQS